MNELPVPGSLTGPRLAGEGANTPIVTPAKAGAQSPVPLRILKTLAQEKFLLAITMLALVYLACSLSPSSYQEVLKDYEIEGQGPLFGWSKVIRSDEYAIWTPTVQIAVANDFGPRNETSFYREEMRSLSAVPLRDWALLFRPQFWGFFVLPPAYGLSAYWTFYYWIFVAGWTLLFRALGAGRGMAAMAALVLLLTPWAQAWWTSFAPLLAIAPLIALPALWPLPGWGRGLAAAWGCAAWLLGGLFYPPLYLAIGLILYLGIVLFRPAALHPRRWPPLLLGGAAGIAIAVFYLWDPLVATAGTVTHGERNLHGGMVLYQDWLSTFQPSLSFRGWSPIYGTVECESSSAGSILWILILAFGLPFSRGAFRLADPWARRAAWAMVGLFAAVSLWMVFPLPAVFGKPLLWHLTPATRLLLLPGLLAIFLALRFLPGLDLRWSLARALRLGIWLAVVFALCQHPLFSADAGWQRRIFDSADLLLIPLILLLPLLDRLVRRLAGEGKGEEGPAWSRPAAAKKAAWAYAEWKLRPATVVAAAALGNLLVFGLYNPVQSTRPIFEQQDSPKLAALRAMQEAHPRHWLVAGSSSGFYGSILNGFGFKALTHSLINPQMETWARLFPEMPAEKRNQVFNRYANIQLAPYTSLATLRPLERPWAPIDTAVLIPYEAFLPKMQVELEPGMPKEKAPRPPAAKTRVRSFAHRQVMLDVQGPIRPLSGRVWVEIHTDPAPYRLKGSWRLPPEDGTAVLGPDFYSLLVVRMALSEPPGPQGLGWCVTIHDRDRGLSQFGPLPGQGRSLCPE